MNRFKISASIDNASEIIDMLVFMGCRLLATKEQLINEIGRGCTKICESGNGIFTTKSEYNSLKEITLQELRDMVVLKRNDVGDATHSVDGLNGSAINLSGKWYVFNFNTREWELWADCFEYRLDDLKPIKGEVMKEYLGQEADGFYHLVKHSFKCCSDWIEVPEGAETFNYFGDEDNQFFLMRNGDETLFAYESNLVWREWGDESFDGVICLWQRNKESLNDKMATIEVARQEEKHNHYKKDVSHLNVIDPYRIADLYDLHPCAEHIMKKSLCAGNRGHKDTLRDIQDIIDTAERWKQMIEEDSNEI